MVNSRDGRDNRGQRAIHTTKQVGQEIGLSRTMHNLEGVGKEKCQTNWQALDSSTFAHS